MKPLPLDGYWAFFRESLRQWRIVGSLAPSSRALARAMALQMNPTQAQVVVELGPGDGIITQYLLERLQPEARLIVVEINPVFVERIRARFQDERLLIIHDSAAYLSRHFQQLGIESADYFVSALPFTTLPPTLARHIVRACYHQLRPGGRFIQFHYVPFMARFYRRIFERVTMQWVAWNFPPAFVLTCEKNPPPNAWLPGADSAANAE